jgi:hypothetical protein
MNSRVELHGKHPQHDSHRDFRLAHLAELQHLLRESLNEALPMGASEHLFKDANRPDDDAPRGLPHDE